MGENNNEEIEFNQALESVKAANTLKYKGAKQPIPAQKYYLRVRIYRTRKGYVLDPGTIYLRRGLQTLVAFKSLNATVTLSIPKELLSTSQKMSLIGSPPAKALPQKMILIDIPPGGRKLVVFEPDANIDLGSRFPYSSVCEVGDDRELAEGHSAPDIIIEDDDNGWP